MPRKPDQPCAQCGTLMWRGTGSLPNGQATCRPCRSASKQKPATETWDCGHCGTTCTRPRTRGQKPRWCSTECRLKGSYQKNICVECGAPGVRNDSVRCSDCATLRPAQRRRASERAARIAAAQRKLDKAAQGTVARSSKVSAHCVICNTHYVTVWYGNHATTRTCSEPCAKEQDRNTRRLGHERRRAREKNAFVANVYRKRVFERDKWRCHICRKKTNKDAVVPHPMAPTIDHLIPLSAGGTHEPANVATACFRCNHTKGARGSGEQLALIG